MIYMKPINTAIGDHIPIGEFVEDVRDGLFTNYDGCAYYATATEESDVRVVFYGNVLCNIDKKWTHVIWYNK